MKITNGRTTRGMMLLAGGAIAASTLMPAAPAQAADKSKTYKAGALVLGAASAYLIIKGKTVPGAVAGAGAYYAYKKSKDAKQNEARYPDDNYYSQSPDGQYPDAQYPDNQYPGDYGYGGTSGGYGDTYPDYALRSKDQARTKSRTGGNGSLVLK